MRGSLGDTIQPKPPHPRLRRDLSPASGGEAITTRTTRIVPFDDGDREAATAAVAHLSKA